MNRARAALPIMEQSNNNPSENLYEQAAAFQKIWAESLSRMAQAAFTLSPESAPPDLARQIRTGIFQAVAQSWEEFMRSPQFLRAMKQMMDQSIELRRITNEFLTRAHHETQSMARSDIDTLMMAVSHLENRVLNQLEALSERLDAFEEKMRAPASAEPPQRTREGAKRKKSKPEA